MNDNLSWKDDGRRLAPMATSSLDKRQSRLPPFSHLAQSIPELRPTSSPAASRQSTSYSRPRGRNQALNARLTPSSPLVHSIGVDVDNESSRFSVDTPRSSSVYSEASGPTSNYNPAKRVRMNPAPNHGIPRGASKPKRVQLSPPTMPPTPPLTSASSDRNRSTYATSVVDTIAADQSLLPSTVNQNIDEYITKLMVLDVKKTGLVQEAQEETNSLFGSKGDPTQIELEALQRRREALLTEWGQDAETLLKDKSLSTFNRRMQIMEIDRRIKLLQIPR